MEYTPSRTTEEIKTNRQKPAKKKSGNNKNMKKSWQKQV